MEKRKPIQLVAIPFSIFGITFSYRLYAVCDDGTVWYSDRLDKKDRKWTCCDDQIPSH